MKNKKSQINQIFVYLLSLLIIAFVGFLVVNFIITFFQITKDSKNNHFYEQFKNDFSSVYTTYGSEKSFRYKVSKNIKLLCFTNKINSCDAIKTNISNNAYKNFNEIFKNGENIGLFDENDIRLSYKLGKRIEIENNCLCIKPVQGRFALIIENNKNKIFLSENQY